VKHLHDVLIAKNFEKGFEVDPFRQGVDDCFFPIRRGLDKTQDRPEGLFAHEFSVDRDERALGDTGGKRLQFSGRGDYAHWPGFYQPRLAQSSNL
jgi:hypothetical protein